MKAEDSGQRMKAGRFAIYRAYKRDTPPICGATSALHPHNFSHHKNRKKFAQEDIIFRTENIEKVSPKGLVDVENFSEIFSGECFG